MKRTVRLPRALPASFGVIPEHAYRRTGSVIWMPIAPTNQMKITAVSVVFIIGYYMAIISVAFYRDELNLIMDPFAGILFFYPHNLDRNNSK